MRAPTIGIIFAALVGAFNVAVAGPLEDGGAALSRGDYATALQILRPLAEQGDAGAQVSVGLIYQYRGGVAQDYREAVRWFLLAANKGLASAQFQVGIMYEEGKGVPQDDQLQNTIIRDRIIS